MIHAIVVTYNVRCSDSKTCQSLAKQTSHDFDVVVYDNSVRDFGNQEFCDNHGWIFLGGAGNKGLSVAYNAAIDFLCQDGASGWICLLDDDTSLPENFMQRMSEYSAANYSSDVLLPILWQSGKIISPCRIHRKNRYFSSIEECMNTEPYELQAFNSCMTIKLSAFVDYRYDERIFLDGVDHAFLRDMKNKGKLITVVPIECEQRFSGGEKEPKNAAISRFRIYSKDSLILHEKEICRYWAIVGRRALHLSLMYRTPIFIWYLFADSKRGGIQNKTT